jgi:hypothetical protein
MSRLLPDRALPSRALPSRALQLIHDFSKPVTHPRWRQSKPIITTYQMYLKFNHLFNTEFTGENLLQYRVLCKIIDTDWYHAYCYILKYGLTIYTRYSISENVLKMDGIEDADYSHCDYEYSYIEYD